ncbi:hypothetical protein K474DRAFT_1675059 [Panus rudis PR-1116 ss-1]|nr:hypothetical protein K474DRAFT_1679972 [Panus rudis PR-1116 ss-1]KAI0077130.1 hypothetical protein K474DRAFT_1675059 [Panus rudis PR-1116 ss-1]
MSLLVEHEQPSFILTAIRHHRIPGIPDSVLHGALSDSVPLPAENTLTAGGVLSVATRHRRQKASSSPAEYPSRLIQVEALCFTSRPVHYLLNKSDSEDLDEPSDKGYHTGRLVSLTWPTLPECPITFNLNNGRTWSHLHAKAVNSPVTPHTTPVPSTFAPLPSPQLRPRSSL